MKPFLFLFAFVTLSALQTFAQSPFQPLYNLPGAPVEGSADDVGDYQQLLAIQNTRTTADCMRAASEVKISLASFYGAPYGNLTAAEVKNWTGFIQSVNLKADATIALAKNQWKRPRPYVTHKDLKPCISRESSTSYPSGHSALAEFYARILEVAFPPRAADFATRALEIAHDRNVGGVHYPIDTRDGRLLGDQIFDDQNQNGDLENRIHQYHP